MLGLLIPTVSSWFNQGSLANQVNGTSSSNSSGAGAAQSSITPSNGTQLTTAFENLISQINAATQGSASTTAATSTASSAPATGQQAVHGRHHGHGGAALSALLEQLDEAATGNTAATGANSLGSPSSATGSTAASAVGGTPTVSAASVTQIEATLNQLLQNLKLAGSSTNAAALNSATTTQSAQSLAQRFAQQGVQARAGHLLRAVV